MVCGPIGRGFESLRLPISLLFRLKRSFSNEKILKSFPFIQSKNYNTVLWQEGLLVDFLQKLSVTRFLTKVVNQSFSVFNEKLIFEPVSRIFLTFLAKPLSLVLLVPLKSFKFSFNLIILLALFLIFTVIFFSIIL